MIDKIKLIFEKYKKMSSPVKATIWFMICSFAQRGISILTTPIFTRILSTTEYGKYSVFDSWLEILTIIFSMKLCTGVYMRGLVKNSEDRERYTSSLLSLSIIIITLWFVVTLVFKEAFLAITGIDEKALLYMFSIILTSTAFGFWSSYKRVVYDYCKLVFVTLLISVIQPIVCIGLVLLADTDKAVARICGIMITELVIYGPLMISMLLKGKKLICIKYWKEAILFNLPLIPHFLSQTILNHSDRLMINYFTGESKTGIYSLAYSLAMIMILFNTSIQNTLSPWTYQKLKEKKLLDIRRINILALGFIAIVNAGLIIIAPEVIRFFAPPAYHEAVHVIPPVAMSVYFLFLYGLFVTIEMYYGKNRGIMFVSVSGAVINIVLNIICIPVFGYVAAAYTTFISYLFYCVLHAFLANRIIRKNTNGETCYDVKKIIVISFVFIICCCICYLLYPFAIVRYGIIVLVMILLLRNINKIRELVYQFISMRR